MRTFTDGCDIVIWGLKHSGKSSVAKALAPFLRATPIDLDELVAKEALLRFPDLDIPKHGFPQIVRSLYVQKGKAVFVDLEAEQCQKLDNDEGLGRKIIATGGGTMENNPAVASLLQNRLSIFLDLPEKILYTRIMRGGHPAFLRESDPEEHFHQIYLERSAIGRSLADLIVAPEASGIETVVALVLKQIKEYLDAR